jgi:hypothetical protein
MYDMYSGVIRNRNIYTLNPETFLFGDIKFHIQKDCFIPPLFVYKDTRYNHCFFINKYGIFKISRCSIFKIRTIENIYKLFNKRKFYENFPKFKQKLYGALNILHTNNINIYFLEFKNIRFDANDIEYHTNLSKDSIVLFQNLNSTLPYPSFV